MDVYKIGEVVDLEVVCNVYIMTIKYAVSSGRFELQPSSLVIS